MSMLSLDMICSANDEQVRKNTFHMLIHYVIHNVYKRVGPLMTGRVNVLIKFQIKIIVKE